MMTKGCCIRLNAAHLHLAIESLFAGQRLYARKRILAGDAGGGGAESGGRRRIVTRRERVHIVALSAQFLNSLKDPNEWRLGDGGTDKGIMPVVESRQELDGESELAFRMSKMNIEERLEGAEQAEISD
ncbi:hypothetical protein niasHT_025797 [Heterodera trifolii]|uniref:Uncharacterized protein n=1 Tax=Heterodera trifolii TaxID=157864 RepID=A0ABD2KRD0_9BILA